MQSLRQALRCLPLPLYPATSFGLAMAVAFGIEVGRDHGIMAGVLIGLFWLAMVVGLVIAPAVMIFGVKGSGQ